MEENKETVLPTHLQKKETTKWVTLSKVMFFASLSFCTLIATSLLLKNLNCNIDYLYPSRVYTYQEDDGYMRQHLLFTSSTKC